MKADWDAIFARAEIDVKVNASISASGEIKNAFGLEE
jgi:hypothetical protein